MRGGSAHVVVRGLNIIMTKVVGLEHVDVVVLLEADGDGVQS